MLHVWRYYITRNLEAERERWVLWLPVLFATGIGIYFALPQEPSMWLTLAVIELTLLAVWLARHQAKLLWLLAGWGKPPSVSKACRSRCPCLPPRRQNCPQECT